MGRRLQNGNGLAPDIVRGTLARTERPGRPGRRRALGHLLWAGAAGTLLWSGRHELGHLAKPADLRTAAGERRDVTLADGTLLRLNTATIVDVRYDAVVRRILLREGEIEVVTSPDPSGRALWVETRDARLVPVGTRFSVLQLPDFNWLYVREGAVDLHLGATDRPVRVTAGKQARFAPDRAILQEPLDESLQAWTEGMLVAADRRLDDLLAEVARHRAGLLQWDSEVADLRITGTWPLEGAQPTDAVLASLERRLPVRLQTLTRYWVRVVHRTEG